MKQALEALSQVGKTIDFKIIVFIGVVWSLTAFCLNLSGFGRFLDSKLALPLTFHARQMLKKSPHLDHRLKIYGMDDRTYGEIEDELTTLDYANIIQLIDQNNPSAVVIDFVHRKVNDPLGKFPEAKRIMDTVKAPVYSGLFLAARDSQSSDLPLSGYPYDLLARENVGKKGLPLKSLPAPFQIYGPGPKSQQLFKNYGHFIYDGYGKIFPLIHLPERDIVIPHLALRVADSLRFQRENLEISDVNSGVDTQGELIVNFLSPESLYERTKMILNLYRQSNSDSVVTSRMSSVAKNDVVLILPNIQTGNTDFKWSPFGYIPGGFVVASVINSVLTGQWLKTLPLDGLIPYAMTAIGCLFGFWPHALLFSGILVIGSFGYIVLAIYLFSYQLTNVSLMLPLICFSGSIGTTFAYAAYIREGKLTILRQALEKMMSKEKLQLTLASPKRISLEPSERVVTVMFIDIVGFSMLAENMHPRLVFGELKNHLDHISEIIQRHGGFIDKTLGDGLLAYFGYSFVEDSSSLDHPEMAVRCAIEIQKENIGKALKAVDRGQAPLFMRIGINSASCYIGNLGSAKRIDITLVGNGVNLAKRLEGACDINHILVSSTTHDFIKGTGLAPQSVAKKFIRIKHHKEFTESFEIDPFYDDVYLKKSALNAFRKYANIDRTDQRTIVPSAVKLRVASDLGQLEVINFSAAGLNVKSQSPLAKGTEFNLRFECEHPAFQERFAQIASIGRGILVRVLWGYREESCFIHGVTFSNNDTDQCKALHELLSEYTRVSLEPPRAG